MTDLKTALLHYANRHADAAGFVTTPIEGVGMMRAFAPTGDIRAIYKPVLCLVLQGAKQVMAGDKVLTFAAGQSLIVSVDVPIVGRVIRAARHAPYLALSLDIDMALMREIMGHAPLAHRERDDGLFVEDLDGAVMDCVARLARLLDRPEAIAVLRPAIVREMHYWLLAGAHGAAIRRLALPDSHTQRIARAVRVLRAAFARPIRIEELAATAGMSSSSFHQHFKAVTSLSPLQFQKQLRLLEARRLMLTEGATAGHAAAAVGYESVSQFTREYARMFGAPPRRDSRAAA